MSDFIGFFLEVIFNLSLLMYDFASKCTYEWHLVKSGGNTGDEGSSKQACKQHGLIKFLFECVF